MDAKKLKAFVEKEKAGPFGKKSSKKNNGTSIDVDAIAENIKNGKGDPQLLKLSKGIDPAHNPPEWVEDEDIWERAKKAVGMNENGESDKYDEPYAVVASVYQKMGGKIKKGK